jgi:hypothetical protein
MTAGIKANADGSAAIQVGGSDAITITSGLVVSMNGGAPYPLISGTAVASTSGTSIDFTSIPSWVKRITVNFSGVSTSGSSPVQIQIGAGSVTTTGYSNIGGLITNANQTSATSATSGFSEASSGAITSAGTRFGSININNLTSNTWVASGVYANVGNSIMEYIAGGIALAGVLDRVRITTVNGTDTFDAGSINILYE